ncbi:MAG: hypothetical protein A2583_07355 [Bdellovibrionales bacterium RIFOXYD1_FULL_53_11]|nr:MAG: hypothetical protein A2583_07355 [Bdellovibrionales bacterium RIFOXYD1_FULL_53_11]
MSPLKLFKKHEDEAPRKREGEDDENKPVEVDETNWLVSYADMMTLLCVFFVLMFSMAKLDEGKYETIQVEIAKQFGNDYKSPSKETALFMSSTLQEAGIEKQVVVKSDPTGVVITFQSTLFFDTMSSEIRPEGKVVMERLIGGIADQQKKFGREFKIIVEGHTDSRPVTSGPYPSNWELSGARASGVVRMFLDKNFTPDKLTAIGYADTRPEYASRTPNGEWDEEALTKNRRVVIRVLEPRVDSIPYPESAKNLTVQADPETNPAQTAH